MTVKLKKKAGDVHIPSRLPPELCDSLIGLLIPTIEFECTQVRFTSKRKMLADGTVQEDIFVQCVGIDPNNMVVGISAEVPLDAFSETQLEWLRRSQAPGLCAKVRIVPVGNDGKYFAEDIAVQLDPNQRKSRKKF